MSGSSWGSSSYALHLANLSDPAPLPPPPRRDRNGVLLLTVLLVLEELLHLRRLAPPRLGRDRNVVAVVVVMASGVGLA